MVTILLEQILELLKGWLSSFTTWAEGVATTLGLIEEQTEYIDDIYDDTEAIKTDTGNIATSNQIIVSNTQGINNRLQSIDPNVTAIKNNVGTISTNTGIAAAFSEDIATNTLNSDNRLITIGSDTTQLRSNSNAITADVSEIKSMLNYFSYGLIVTEDVEGPLCSFDTDLIDYIQNLKVNIDPDNDGFSSINITRCGKNLLPSLLSAVTVNNITFSPLSDGAIDINGTASGNASVDVGRNEGCFLQAGTYYVNITATPYTITVFGIVNGTVTIIKSGGGSFTLTNPTQIFVRVFIASGTAVNHLRLPLQLELGSTETDFEPYKENTFNISLGSTVTDGGELNALTGVLKVNTTPPTYSVVDPIAIKTFKGINNIWADTGDSMVTYKETLKHKIDKEA